MNNMPQLRRTLTWKMLALYGLGNILGAGIYVLIGEVAQESGDALVWSFLIAAIVASFTALTYSAMASAYPVSAGAAVYSERAFKIKALSATVGLALALTAVVSSSALLRGFSRYAKELLSLSYANADQLPDQLIMLPLLALLSFFAFRGIKESTKLAVIFTVLEASGLLIIVVIAGIYGDVGTAVLTSVQSFGEVDLWAIGLGGFVAFYAFIGFEDMVNVAEEVKQPKQNIKRGMLTALSVATVLYILVALAAIAVLPSTQLAGEKAPLAAVFSSATGSSIPLITIIGIVAITNGVLIQIITSSRILYGLAREGWIPKVFATINQQRKTPQTATAVSVLSIAVASSLLPLGTLAQITSFMLLVIFTIVHVAALKLIKNHQLHTLPVYIPICGILLNVGVVMLQIWQWIGTN